MARADSLAKLAFAYGVHLTRRRLTRPRPQVAALLETYSPDGLRPLLPDERTRHPHLIGCINCGLCALAAGRIGKVRLPDLASSYMRLYSRVGEASTDFEGDGPTPDLEAAAAACPVGVPLPEVAAIVRRLTAG
jgi:ferredoxin